MTDASDTVTITLPKTDHVRLALKAFRATLRELTDPLGDNRKGDGHWIVFGRFNPKGGTVRTPRVYIRLDDEIPQEMYLGPGPRTYRLMIETDIRVREEKDASGGVAQIDGVQYKNSELVVAIFDMISNHIDLNNRNVSISDTKGTITQSFVAIDFMWRMRGGGCHWDVNTGSWTMKSLWAVQCHKQI